MEIDMPLTVWIGIGFLILVICALAWEFTHPAEYGEDELGRYNDETW